MMKMSRMSETPEGVLETYDWEDVAEDLQERIDKALTNIDVLQEIIKQQPTENKEDDKWILEKLDGIKHCLKRERK